MTLKNWKLFVVIAGLSFFSIRTLFGCLNNEINLYSTNYSFLELVLYKWLLNSFHLTALVYLTISIITKLKINWEEFGKKYFLLFFLGSLSFCLVLAYFITNENSDAGLRAGVFGIFQQKLFWINLVLLFFYLLPLNILQMIFSKFKKKLQ
jgi:hypothetical protein